MLLLDYHTTVRHQLEDVYKCRRKIKPFFNKNWVRQWLDTLIQRSIDKAIAQVNERLTTQLFNSKGILVDLQAKADEFQEKDFSTLIHQVGGLIKQNVIFIHEIEIITEADKRGQFPNLNSTDSLLNRIIEVQYDILRIIKRYNKKSSQETSDLAKECSKRSISSLKTIIKDRSKM